MPCYVTGSREGDLAMSLKEAHHTATNVTQLLCCQCELLENTKNTHLMHFSVKEWWTKHKKIDEDRRKKEAKEIKKNLLKQKALSKLTKEEKEALNL